MYSETHAFYQAFLMILKDLIRYYFVKPPSIFLFFSYSLF